MEVQEASDVPITVKVKGVYVADPMGSSPSPVVLLEDEGGRVVPIFVGISEAISIHHALTGEVSPRPMTHDLFMSTLEVLDARISRVLIDDLEGGVYYARLSITSGSQVREIDSRPSDCLALALRAKVPVQIHEKVLVESEIKRGDIESLKGIEDFMI